MTRRRIEAPHLVYPMIACTVGAVALFAIAIAAVVWP